MQYAKASAPPLTKSNTELPVVPALSVVDIDDNEIINSDQVMLLEGESTNSTGRNNRRAQRKINLLNHKGNVVNRSALKAADDEAEGIKKAQSNGWKLTMEEEIAGSLANQEAYYSNREELNGIRRQEGSNTSRQVDRTLHPEDVARPINYADDGAPIKTDPSIIAGTSEPVPLGMTYSTNGYKSIYDDPNYVANTYNVSEPMSYGGEYKINEYKSIYDQKDEK